MYASHLAGFSHQPSALNPPHMLLLERDVSAPIQHAFLSITITSHVVQYLEPGSLPLRCHVAGHGILFPQLHADKSVPVPRLCN